GDGSRPIFREAGRLAEILASSSAGCRGVPQTPLRALRALRASLALRGRARPLRGERIRRRTHAAPHRAPEGSRRAGGRVRCDLASEARGGAPDGKGGAYFQWGAYVVRVGRDGKRVWPPGAITEAEEGEIFRAPSAVRFTRDASSFIAGDTAFGGSGDAAFVFW